MAMVTPESVEEAAKVLRESGELVSVRGVLETLRNQASDDDTLKEIARLESAYWDCVSRESTNPVSHHR